MSGRKLGESGAFAVVDIPAGSKSSAFTLSNISKRLDLDKVPFPFEVCLSQNKEIRPTAAAKGLLSNVPYFWPKIIQFAPDCQLQNVKVCRVEKDLVVLQATRFIRAGQQLYLWFEENILVEDLRVPPYLNPANIRGGKSYVCQKCGNEFEAPNPLKVHIALECGRFSKNILWSRLAERKPIVAQTLMVTPFPTLTRPTSCFLPSQMLRGIEIPPDPSPQVSSTNTSSSPVSSSQQLVAQKTHAEHQAHLEAIMSNMGKSKNGHVCLYCGKLYSRKYGLKIHIRTHTGFKPLFCRICKRPFGDPSNLNKHVRLHSDGNTPYRCDICAKVLVRKRDLDRHIRSRHPNLLPHRRALPLHTISSTVSSSGVSSSVND